MSGSIHGRADELHIHSWPGEGEDSWARVTQSHHPRDECCVHNFMPTSGCKLAAGVDQQVWTLPGIDVEK